MQLCGHVTGVNGVTRCAVKSTPVHSPLPLPPCDSPRDGRPAGPELVGGPLADSPPRVWLVLPAPPLAHPARQLQPPPAPPRARAQ